MTNLASLRRVSMITGAAAIALSGCSPARDGAPTAPDVGTASEAVSNGQEDFSDRYKFVGQYSFPEGNGFVGCSGTLITPTWVLTAAHCFVPTRINDVIPCNGMDGTVDHRNDTFQIVFANDPTSPTAIRRTHTASKSGPVYVRDVNNSTCTHEGIGRDVALFKLDERVALSDLQPLHPGGLSGSPLEPTCAAAVPDNDDFSAYLVGFGQTDPSEPRDGPAPGFRTVAFSDNWNREAQDGDEAVYENSWTFTSYTGILPGDSGGALISTTTGNFTLCGVNSVGGAQNNLGLGLWTGSSELPSVDSNPNLDFLRSHIMDSKGRFMGECKETENGMSTDADYDHDTIPDGCDPCPFNQDANYNLDPGPDGDGDGVPDRCDNCNPGFCDSLGLPAAACANPTPAAGLPQSDSDGDGMGDTCDFCPDLGNPGLAAFVDADKDRVPDICDNCNASNPVKACTTDADCSRVANGHVVSGNCTQTDSPTAAIWGRCDFTLAACLSDAECGPDHACRNIGTYGRCYLQTDDLDGDGIGGSCDNCPGTNNSGVTTNSNDVAESRLGATPMGDACEPVPLFVSRQILEPVQRALPNPSATVTRFAASGGIGAQSTANLANLRVGFRHCSCRLDFLNVHADIDESTCIQLKCSSDPTEFGMAGTAGTNWTRVTVGINSGANTFTIPTLTIPQSTADSTHLWQFDKTLHCDDNFLHPNVNETCRIGSEDSLIWFHDQDVRSNLVPSFDNGSKTTGLFWSHTWASTTTDARETGTNGALRNSYEYVRTATQNLFQIDIGQTKVANCYGSVIPKPRCQLFYRGDVPHTAGPLTCTETNPCGPLDALHNPNRFVYGADGHVVSVRGIIDPVYDVTSSLSASLVNLMASGVTTWLSPAEPGNLLHAASVTTLGVAVPQNWQPDAPISEIVRTGNQLTTQVTSASASGLPPSMTLPSVQPDVRSSARTLLSGRERTVYMIGGKTSAGAQTGEIWSYPLDAAQWVQLWQPSNATGGQPSPANVLAAAYDGLTRRLLILDEANVTTTVLGNPVTALYARILQFDIATKRMSLVFQVPRLGLFASLSLTTQADGSFVLLGNGTPALTGWTAFRFTVSSNAVPTWTGLAAGIGTLADDPIATDDQLLVPMRVGTAENLVGLPPSSFLGTNPCTQL